MKTARTRRPRATASSAPASRPATAASRVPDATEEGAWREWIGWFGRRLRRMRTGCGLSQQDVATLAGVSQGAISRLEAGHGLATPLLLVVKIDLALTRHLSGVDPLWVDVQAASEPGLSRLVAGLADERPLGADTATEELVRLYHRTPPRIRQQLLAIARAAANALDTSDG